MESLIKRAVPALIISCLAALALAQNTNQLPRAEREHILDGQFKVVSTTEGIPANIKHAFSQLSRQSSFAMANPGQKFQLGDAVVDRNLPFRRLLFAGFSRETWFIHYERGGRAHSYYIVVFRVNPSGDAHFIGGGSVLDRARNMDQLRKMIAGGQISDARNVYY